MKFNKLTEDQLSMLKDTSNTTKDLSVDLGIGEATVCRWRKQMGVIVPKGSKRGKPRPWQTKKEERSCLCCGKLYVTTPSSSKKYCSLNCSTASIDRSYMITDEYRNTLRKDSTPEYRRYSRMVHALTAKTYRKYKHQINPNNFKRGLAGVPGAYHLDHIVSIRYGFDNNMLPEQLAVVENLQMLPWAQNISKGKK